ncbi:MAG: hypothetical protein ACYTFO_10325 [Planctomycetota bacterium]|jgi:hypothetical protein
MSKRQAPKPKAESFIIRVNVGGPEITDWTGKLWSADRKYVAGSWGCLDSATTDILTSTEDIACIEKIELFQ